jgi:hypothetical protein
MTWWGWTLLGVLALLVIAIMLALVTLYGAVAGLSFSAVETFLGGWQ